MYVLIAVSLILGSALLIRAVFRNVVMLSLALDVRVLYVVSVCQVRNDDQHISDGDEVHACGHRLCGEDKVVDKVCTRHIC